MTTTPKLAGAVLEVPSASRLVQAASFHPTEPHLLLCIDDKVYVADLYSRSLMPPIASRNGSASGVYSLSHIKPSLLAAYNDDESALYVWDAFERRLVHMLPMSRFGYKKEKDRKVTPFMDVSSRSPRFYFVAPGSKTVFVIDLLTSTMANKIELKKQASCLCLRSHEKSEWVIAGSADGVVRVHGDTGVVSFEDIPGFETSKGYAHEGISAVAAHPWLPLVAGATSGGVIGLWKIGFPKGAHRKSEQPIASLVFHPVENILLVVCQKGLMMAFRYFFNGETIQLEKQGEVAHVLEDDEVAVKAAFMHPIYNFLFLLGEKRQIEIKDSLDSSPLEQHVQASTMRLKVFSTDFKGDPRSLLPSVVQRQQPSADYYARPVSLADGSSNLFLFPNESFMLSFADKEGRSLEPRRVVYSHRSNAFCAFFDYPNSGDIIPVYATFTPERALEKDVVVAGGVDACFSGRGEEETLNILSHDRLSLLIVEPPYHLMYKTKSFQFASPVKAIFSTPLNQGSTVMLLLENSQQLHFANFDRDDPALRRTRIEFPKDAFHFQLESDEEIVQVQWLSQMTDNSSYLYVCALVTTRHIYLVRTDLTILAVYTFPLDSSDRPHVTSCLWVGYSLIFATGRTVMYMTLKGRVYPLLHLDRPWGVLLSALCDRVVLAYTFEGEPRVVAHAVGMLEPLIMGYVHCASVFENFPPNLGKQLSTIVRCYESTRCSFALLEELDFAGLSSLALALTEHNPILVHERPWMRFSLALRALQFKTAAEILRNKFIAMGSPQPLPPNSELAQFARYLCDVAVHYAQFETAYSMAVMILDPARIPMITALAQKKAGSREPTPLLSNADATAMAAIVSAQREKPSRLGLGKDVLYRDWPIDSLDPDSSKALWRPSSSVNLKMATMPHLSGPGGYATIPFINLDQGAASWCAIEAEMFDLPAILEASLLQRAGRGDVSEKSLSETKSDSDDASSESVSAPSKKSASSAATTPSSSEKQHSPRSRLSKRLRNPTSTKDPVASTLAKPTPAPHLASAASDQSVESFSFDSGGGFDVSAAELVRSAIADIEKDKIVEAKGNLSIAIYKLSQSGPFTALRFAAMYHFLASVLLAFSESGPVDERRHAVLSRALADLPLLPRHRIICLRLAIRKNLAVKNFSTAARFIKLLLLKAPIDAADLQALLDKAETNSKDAVNVDLLTSYSTMLPIDEPSFYQCLKCAAVFGGFSDPCLVCSSKQALKEFPNDDDNRRQRTSAMMPKPRRNLQTTKAESLSMGEKD